MPEGITAVRPRPVADRVAVTKAAKPQPKPRKPYPDFPLFPHATKRWAKKIRGKFAFFGPWDDPHGALERYVAQRDALHAGFVPRGTTPTTRTATGSTSAAASQSAGRRTARSAASSATDGTEATVEDLPNDLPSTARASQRTVRTHGNDNALTMRALANHFLTAKQRLMSTGELSARAFNDYFRNCEYVLRALGKDRRVDDLTASDLGRLREALGKNRGPLTLSIHIQRTRSLFKHGFDAGLMEKPLRFGPEFKKPSLRSLRLAKRARGEMFFEPTEIKQLLEVAGVQMRAMILLGLNAGLGNTDVATLMTPAIDLRTGVLDSARTKTGIPRRAILWPETVEALRATAKVRPEPVKAEHRHLLFITKYGHPWVRMQAPGERSKGRTKVVLVDAVSLEFGKLQRELGFSRRGGSFYALRHTFRTVADEVLDRPAIDLVMGHQDGQDVATNYVEKISDERLKNISDHVRTWLFR